MGHIYQWHVIACAFFALGGAVGLALGAVVGYVAARLVAHRRNALEAASRAALLGSTLILALGLAACREAAPPDESSSTSDDDTTTEPPTCVPPAEPSEPCIAPATPTPLVGLRSCDVCTPIACVDDSSIRLCEANDGACVLGSCVSIACSGWGCP